MTRYRVTVRGVGMELRGFVTAASYSTLERLAAQMHPAAVMASPADPDYDPFSIPDDAVWRDTIESQRAEILALEIRLARYEDS